MEFVNGPGRAFVEGPGGVVVQIAKTRGDVGIWVQIRNAKNEWIETLLSLDKARRLRAILDEAIWKTESRVRGKRPVVCRACGSTSWTKDEAKPEPICNGCGAHEIESLTLHVLRAGRSLCGRDGFPAEWEPNERWIRFDAALEYPDQICESCRDKVRCPGSGRDVDLIRGYQCSVCGFSFDSSEQVPNHLEMPHAGL